MRKKRRLPNTKKQHCKNCGYVTNFSDKVDNYLELKPEQLSPWRCSNCNAVYEFVDPDDLSKGYKLVNTPDPLEPEPQDLREKYPGLNRAELRKKYKGNGRSKHTRKVKK